MRQWPSRSRRHTELNVPMRRPSGARTGPLLKASRPETVLALTDYGGPITAVVGRDNLAGTQFHPEKSQLTGLRLIANFLRWKP